MLPKLTAWLGTTAGCSIDMIAEHVLSFPQCQEIMAGRLVHNKECRHQDW